MPLETAARRAQVAVIGGGAVGASIARELASSGRDVLVLDAGASWGSGASSGNAGLVCPSHAGPWATRREMGQAVRWLFRRDSPLSMRPSPALVPFFARLAFLGEERVRLAGTVNRAMARRALELHRGLVDAGLATGFRQRGLLDVYEDERRFEDARRTAAAQRADGVEARVLSAAELAVLEPQLAVPAVGAVHFPGDAHLDPVAFMRELGADAVAKGARWMPGVHADRLVRSGGGVRVETDRGEIVADRVVVAAGAASGTLLRRRLSMLQAGRGYAVELAAENRALPERPIMLQEQRVAVTPMPGRLRLAGTMAFAGLRETVDAPRLAAVERAGREAFPGWAGASASPAMVGLRPCTPDGLPMIGHLDDRVFLATGHAMLGVALAPETGERVRRMLDGEPVEHEAALRPDRF